MLITIKKGLDIPIAGTPEQSVYDGGPVTTVALLGDDYVGMKPTMLTHEGESVRLGQALFADRKMPEIRYTSPGAGTIVAINRGAKRALQSVVIRLHEKEEIETFNSYPRSDLGGLNAEQVKDNLLESGLWTAFRTRPFNKVPHPETRPDALFVTAMDTNPLAPDPEVVLRASHDDFKDGLTVIEKLSTGPVHVCKRPRAEIPVIPSPRIKVAEFAGPHPAGLVGTHIHFLDPVTASKTVWHVSYQDTAAIGRLFTSGRLCVERVIALGGPVALRPRLIRTRLGANTKDLLQSEYAHSDARVVSGSVLCGHRAAGWASFLGRYHQQLTVLPEGRNREFLGWIRPGRDKFSATNVFVSCFFRKTKQFALTTSQQGSPRAMIPIGSYEQVMPLDILPTQLLRALLVRDTDTAQALGCLELAEEDLALCTFVSPSKFDYGLALQANLEQIEKEG